MVNLIKKLLIFSSCFSFSFFLFSLASGIQLFAQVIHSSEESIIEVIDDSLEDNYVLDYHGESFFRDPRSCFATDNRNEYLGKNRDQKTMAWCYAFTAADLLQHRFMMDQRLSASDVAITYNQNATPSLMKSIGNLIKWFRRQNWQREHETGFIAIALSETIQRGACLAEDFSDNTMIRYNRSTQQEEVVNFEQGMLELQEMRRFLQAHHHVNLQDLPYTYKFANVEQNELERILLSSSYRQLLYQITSVACGQREKIESDGRIRIRQFLRGRRTFDRIDQQLARGRIVSIDYFGGVLQNPQHFSPRISELHTSSIVGKRFNHDRDECEYLIRDSYSDKCEDNGYDPGLECEDGNVWMTASDLYRSLVSIVYID